jgi:urease accessory protein
VKKYLMLAICLVALPAAAHPGHAAGFAAGLAHPFTGLDHLLAMLGMGIWSRKQGQALAIPVTFVLMMAVGALAQFGVAAPESWIAASVVLTGLLLVSKRLPPAAALMVAGAFALMHGQAHGRELPQLASAAGYLLSSAALLLAGSLLMLACRFRRDAAAPA